MSTNQINSHFVNKIASQNCRVQIDYLIMLESPNQLVQIVEWLSFYAHHFGFFLLENPLKKSMNCHNEIV